MKMGLLTLLQKNPATFLILAVPLLYSIIAHEVAHGWVAYLFGDDTAKRSGRLSLNPLVHLDPMGTIALFLVGFGWAKPVPIGYSNLKNLRLGLICISLAGCLTNFAIATIAMYFLYSKIIAPNTLTGTMFVWVVKVNIMLGVLNLIPIPPLDGSKILMGFLPGEGQRVLAGIEPYGVFILIGLIFMGVLNPLIAFAYSLIFYIIKFIT